MMIPKGLGGVRKRRNIAKTVRSIAKCAKDCLVSESSSQGVKGLNGAKIFETSQKSFAFRENTFAECENRSRFFGSRVCTFVILLKDIGGNELRFQRLGHVADLS